MASLFGQYQRTDPSPKRHSESAYQFVDRSARPKVSAVRALFESWFGAYPKAQQAELQGRCVADFYAAFFELFLYSYFKNGGYEVTPHPQVADSTRKPDYLVEKDGCRFYLEAIIARDLSDEEAAKGRVKNLLLDAINDTPSPNFFLHLREFTIVPGKQPSSRRIRAFLKRELATIDPDSVDASQLARPLFDGPGLTYQETRPSRSLSP